MSLQEIIKQLKDWFPPEAHKLRELPGGGNWYFVPWQSIRERLDDACPSWQVSYTEPIYVGSYCSLICTITIEGVSRQGVGNAEIELLSKSGKDMSRGTPIERATADAFKNAAEAWGIARYLDEQTDPKTKQAFGRYMQKHGRGDVAVNYHKNEGNLPKERQPDPPSKPFGRPSKPVSNSAPTSEPATDNKARFKQVMQWTGHTIEQMKAIAQGVGLPASSLSPLQADKLRDEMFIDWAMSKNVYSNPFHARASFGKVTGQFETPDIDDAILWQLWSEKVLSKEPQAV